MESKSLDLKRVQELARILKNAIDDHQCNTKGTLSEFAKTRGQVQDAIVAFANELGGDPVRAVVLKAFGG